MLKEKLKTIPHLPGSYQMRNINNTVIYVGKAKDLYKRVNSYFKGNVTGKTAKMVSEVVDFTYITTSTEQEAFILELNLIKEYDPKYNILLKDDKSYPYIELTDAFDFKVKEKFDLIFIDAAKSQYLKFFNKLVNHILNLKFLDI